VPTELDTAAASALDKALALMNDSGAHWVQGTFRTRKADGSLAYCSIGALHEALIGYETTAIVETNDPVLQRAAQALVRAYLPTLPAPADMGYENVYKVEAWNDDPRTSWEKVVKRFTRARNRLLKESA